MEILKVYQCCPFSDDESNTGSKQEIWRNINIEEWHLKVIPEYYFLGMFNGGMGKGWGKKL